ncbi:DNA/RNA non-specific endonuclease [Virgibacillus pantothenticus]|uniref:DNA/RNA non-specific endonuclease n=1 Tax=Virgibacillus pantothenticus TaxID=1473 RepID=UPI002E225FC1
MNIFNLPDDEGGHLIARIFKGSGDLDNLVPMNGNLIGKSLRIRGGYALNLVMK